VRRRTVPLYAGGFLGPFGGAMLIALIPEVADGLDTTVQLVAASITAYMVPFATLQLFSGTIGERIGGGRVVRTAYAVYGAAALLAAFAPEIWTFMGARALQGAANAFVTPILLAALSEAVPAGVLGRSVGTFAAVQVAGLTLAPALGGALGEVSWRFAFALVAVVSLALAVAGVELRGPAPEDRRHATLRSLLNRWIALVGAKAVAGYLGFTSIGFVVALVCSREFGLSPAATGIVVAAYGVGGMLLGRYGGTVTDRAGRPRTAVLGILACAGGVLALTFAPNAWSLAVVYFAVGCASAFAWAALNTIVLESFPENRAGAVSVYSAFKFTGVAIAPLIYVPLFETDVSLPFLVAAAFSLLCALLVTPWFRRYRLEQPAPATPV
jgi:MFS family permease